MFSEQSIPPVAATLCVRYLRNAGFSFLSGKQVQSIRRRTPCSRRETPSRTSTWLFVFFLCCVCLVAVSGCGSRPTKAPVIDRAPPTTAPDTKIKPSVPVGELSQIYTVKKGDTLIGIALDFGLDYKELAAWNDIANPGEIHAGQQLKLSPPEQQVVTAPLKTVPGVEGKPVTETEKKQLSEMSSANTALLKVEPKAVVLPYSDQNLAQLQHPTPVKIAKADPNSQPESNIAKGDDEESIDWGWPTNGKVVSGFSESANIKGIQISGKAGQPVIASAPGKVIYSGGGIRGYGKLIIVKHGKNFASVYAHNDQILVKEGQNVVKGQKIAEMGNSDTNQVILHFEIRRLGNPVDPMKYLPAENAS